MRYRKMIEHARVFILTCVIGTGFVKSIIMKGRFAGSEDDPTRHNIHGEIGDLS